MEIKYLTQLKNYPSGNPTGLTYKRTIVPIPLSEIAQLEALYINNSFFPVALKELLFLAGNYCYVLATGTFDTQQEMQEYVRVKLVSEDLSISRPFFVIDVYNTSDQFLFVYLDDGDNPAVYEAVYDNERPDWIHLVMNSLSGYIDTLIERVKEGRNPF